MFDFPPDVARVLVGYARAYAKQPNRQQRDMIALEVMERLKPYMKGQKLRLFEVRELLEKMRNAL